jgi:hypothetical protein
MVVQSWPWVIVAVVGILILLGAAIKGISMMHPENRYAVLVLLKGYVIVGGIVGLLILIGCGIDYGFFG